MNRRRFLLALWLALAVLVEAGGLWWLYLPHPGVTEANCAWVKDGMRQAEIEAIFGRPPDGEDAPSRLEWRGGEGRAVVTFASDGRSARTEFYPAHKSYFRPLLDALRRLYQSAVPGPTRNRGRGRQSTW